MEETTIGGDVSNLKMQVGDTVPMTTTGDLLLAPLVEGVHLGTIHATATGQDEKPDLSTFEGRAAAVAAKGGRLDPHTCCPKCGNQDPAVHPKDDGAHCERCGWVGQRTDLHDTVQSGATKIPGA